MAALLLKRDHVTQGIGLPDFYSLAYGPIVKIELT